MTRRFAVVFIALLMLVLLHGCDMLRPMANFTLAPESGEGPLTVAFTNHSQSGPGLVLRHHWDFGDGSPPSNEESPTHVYETPGIYSVSLTVLTTFGRDAMTRPGIVHVHGPEAEVIADFEAAPATGYPPLTVAFNDTTATRDATIRKWRWQFGDGAVSDEQHPRHTYQTPGVYTVSLTVDTDIGRFRCVKPNSVIVESPETLFTASRAIIPNEVAAPGDYRHVNVVITCDTPAALTALGLRETLPDGWTYVNMLDTGMPPHQARQDEAGNTMFFEWVDIPEFPVQFTYRIQATQTCEEETLLTGILDFRFTGPAFELRLEDSALLCLAPVPGEGEPDPGEGEEEGESIEGEAQPEGEPHGDEGEPAEGENANEEERYVALQMTRRDDTEKYAYAPGQELEITVRLEKLGAGALEALRVIEQLPAGWTYAGLRDGMAPDQAPAGGAAGALHFAWNAATPSLPLYFTYAVVPPDSADRALFTGMAHYAIGGVDFFSNEAQTYFRRYETLLHINRSVTPSAYAPGASVDMTVHYALYGVEPVLAFGYIETLPPGFVYEGLVASDGPEPAIAPSPGAEDALEFAWIETPPMPGSFTYRVVVPETAVGQEHFSGQGLYRFTGAEQKTTVSEIVIPQARP